MLLHSKRHWLSSLLTAVVKILEQDQSCPHLRSSAGSCIAFKLGVMVLCSVAAACAATLQEMNPLVCVTSASGSVAAPPEPSALDGFHVAFVAGSSLTQLQRWDDACSAAGVPFFGAMSRGTVAFLFADLLQHTYTAEVHPSCSLARSLRSKNP